MFQSISSHQLRRRIQTPITTDSLTEQSHTKMCDINNVMNRFKETGQLPYFKEKTPYYTDNTNLPTFEEAHDIIQDAKNAYLNLPLEIRQLTEHDPAKLQKFLSDKQNQSILLKHGLLTMTNPNDNADPILEQNKLLETIRDSLKPKSVPDPK